MSCLIGRKRFGPEFYINNIMSKREVLLGDWYLKNLHDQDREFLRALKTMSKKELSDILSYEYDEDWKMVAVRRELKRRYLA